MRDKKRHHRLFYAGLAVLAALIGYEAAFRYFLRTSGEVNSSTSPVSLYFTCDNYLPGSPIHKIFWI